LLTILNHFEDLIKSKSDRQFSDQLILVFLERRIAPKKHLNKKGA
jgi:hypothetical protein